MIWSNFRLPPGGNIETARAELAPVVIGRLKPYLEGTKQPKVKYYNFSAWGGQGGTAVVYPEDPRDIQEMVRVLREEIMVGLARHSRFHPAWFAAERGRRQFARNAARFPGRRSRRADGRGPRCGRGDSEGHSGDVSAGVSGPRARPARTAADPGRMAHRAFRPDTHRSVGVSARLYGRAVGRRIFRRQRAARHHREVDAVALAGGTGRAADRHADGRRADGRRTDRAATDRRALATGAHQRPPHGQRQLPAAGQHDDRRGPGHPAEHRRAEGARVDGAGGAARPTRAPRTTCTTRSARCRRISCSRW